MDLLHWVSELFGGDDHHHDHQGTGLPPADTRTARPATAGSLGQGDDESLAGLPQDQAQQGTGSTEPDSPNSAMANLPGETSSILPVNPAVFGAGTDAGLEIAQHQTLAGSED